MSEAALSAGSASAIPDSPPGRRKPNFFMWFIQALPFLVLTIGAVIGMAATTITGQPKRLYWSIFTPVAAIVCVLEGWRLAKTAGDYTSTLFTQVFQWLGVGVAMYLVTMTSVRAMMNDDSVGLSLLTVVALSVFTSGVYMRAWRLLVSAGFLAGAVFAISFVEAYAIVLMGGVLAVLCILGLVGWLIRK
ncbi:MAG: hypothetical protein JSS43_14780 [Proteobacteria bacterium]|nr:hypothetical protein [Pseudomonadota bacterium]